MKRIVLCLLFVVLLAPLALGAEPAPASWPTPAVASVAEVPVTATVAESEAKAEAERVQRRLIRKHRRPMGVTFWKVYRVLKQMDERGELQELNEEGELQNKSSFTLAGEVLGHLAASNPQAYKLPAGASPDAWNEILDALMNFLFEILIPLLLNIFFRT